MHDVRLEAAYQLIERVNRLRVRERIHGASELGQDQRVNAATLGVVGHVALVRVNVATDECAFVVRCAELLGQQRDVNRRPADVQAGDDTQNANGFIKHSEKKLTQRRKDAKER